MDLSNSIENLNPNKKLDVLIEIEKHSEQLLNIQATVYKIKAEFPKRRKEKEK